MKTTNFKHLVKGNDISSIIQAIQFLQPKVREELMKEYKVASVTELAKKLQWKYEHRPSDTDRQYLSRYTELQEQDNG